MTIALKNISKLLFAILIVIPAGFAAIFTSLDILVGVGKHLGSNLDIVFPIGILALYVISVIWTVWMLFEQRFKKIGIVILLGLVLTLVSMIVPPHSYQCYGSDSSSKEYSTRGWPVGMIRTGDAGVDCFRGLFDVTMNTIFWYSIASIITIFQIKKKENDAIALTTQ